MANWDETAACKRDDYDKDNGRGHGKVNQFLKLFPNNKGVDIFFSVLLMTVSYFLQIVNDITTRQDTQDGAGSSGSTNRDNPSAKKIWNVLDEMQRNICDVQKQVALIPDVLKCVKVPITSASFSSPSDEMIVDQLPLPL